MPTAGELWARLQAAEKEHYDQRVTSELRAAQADLYDARAAVLADPRPTRAQREHAAEMERAARILYPHPPGADAELQAEAERETGT